MRAVPVIVALCVLGMFSCVPDGVDGCSTGSPEGSLEPDYSGVSVRITGRADIQPSRCSLTLQVLSEDVDLSRYDFELSIRNRDFDFSVTNLRADEPQTLTQEVPLSCSLTTNFQFTRSSPRPSNPNYHLAPTTIGGSSSSSSGRSGGSSANRNVCERADDKALLCLNAHCVLNAEYPECEGWEELQIGVTRRDCSSTEDTRRAQLMLDLSCVEILRLLQ